MTTLPSHPPGGRDRRRRLSSEDRRQLFLRADGRCQRIDPDTGERCNAELPDNWHESHLVAYANGGATNPANMQAWCPPCNLHLGRADAIVPDGLELRSWQSLALPTILEQIYHKGFATLDACPGAGKTIFAGLVFQALQQMGVVERLVVFVPNDHLREQWREALADHLRIHLDDNPSEGWREHRGTVGSIVTYQALGSLAKVHGHAKEVEAIPTLVVLDEVHHLAEDGIGLAAGWGKGIAQVVGDVTRGTIHAAAVLNMTGTLFRSKARRRISTVRYIPIEDGRIEATADFSVRVTELVPHQLRPVNLYAFGSSIRTLDRETGEEVTETIADLDAPKRATALRAMLRKQDWLTQFSLAALDALAKQKRCLQSHGVRGPIPLKLLFVASTQDDARRAAKTIDLVTKPGFARIITSDERNAGVELRRAARERSSLAIVTCKMVTEGFDCPEISTIAYASNVIAQLSVRQTVARAMRLTDIERNVGKVLPAQIIIPDFAATVEAFSWLLDAMPHILDPDEIEDPDRPARNGQGPREARYEVLDVSAPALQSAIVVGAEDGIVKVDELTTWQRVLAKRGVDAVYAPQIIVAAREIRRSILEEHNRNGN